MNEGRKGEVRGVAGEGKAEAVGEMSYLQALLGTSSRLRLTYYFGGLDCIHMHPNSGLKKRAFLYMFLEGR